MQNASITRSFLIVENSLIVEYFLEANLLDASLRKLGDKSKATEAYIILKLLETERKLLIANIMVDTVQNVFL